MNVENSQIMANNMRKNIVQLTYNTGNIGAHIAPSLSIVDILAVLYGLCLKDKDKFILSKGHGALALYTVLKEVNLLTEEELYSFEKPESILSGQPQMNVEKGIEISSGSLGMGLSIGVGIALANKKKNIDAKTYVLMGDGECNEGTVWEAAMSGVNFGLNNLVAIVDKNGMQSDGKCCDVLKIDLNKQWEGFGWKVINVNGHDHNSLLSAFELIDCFSDLKPVVIIAETIKGYGISFMEHNNDWHHNKLTKEQYEKAMGELWK